MRGKFLGVVVVDLDPKPSLQEQARGSAGRGATPVSFVVDETFTFVMVLAGKILVPGLHNEPAVVGRAGCVDH